MLPTIISEILLPVIRRYIGVAIAALAVFLPLSPLQQSSMSEALSGTTVILLLAVYALVEKALKKPFRAIGEKQPGDTDPITDR